MKLEKDLREFIELLNAHDVRCLIVGAFAVAHHGRPRYTGDIDLFFESSARNALLLKEVLDGPGFADLGIGEQDFTTPEPSGSTGRCPIQNGHNDIDNRCFF